MYGQRLSTFSTACFHQVKAHRKMYPRTLTQINSSCHLTDTTCMHIFEPFLCFWFPVSLTNFLKPLPCLCVFTPHPLRWTQSAEVHPAVGTPWQKQEADAHIAILARGYSWACAMLGLMLCPGYIHGDQMCFSSWLQHQIGIETGILPTPQITEWPESIRVKLKCIYCMFTWSAYIFTWRSFMHYR